jgi:NAD(P)H dehydrogenase (quinone)
MPVVLIIHHSGYGHTARVAHFVHEGAASVAGCESHLLTVEQAEADWEAMDRADAIIFGCPTYMGGPSARFKEFMDRTSKVFYRYAWKDKLAAGFTTSGNLAGDKLATLQQLFVFACQHQMIWLSLGIPVPGSSSGHGAGPEAINRVGGSVGLMTQSDDAPPEDTPSPGDIETARLFGVRVAQAARRWSTQNSAS